MKYDPWRKWNSEDPIMRLFYFPLHFTQKYEYKVSRNGVLLTRQIIRSTILPSSSCWGNWWRKPEFYGWTLK
jgi:hypothetical protein